MVAKQHVLLNPQSREEYNGLKPNLSYKWKSRAGTPLLEIPDSVSRTLWGSQVGFTGIRRGLAAKGLGWVATGLADRGTSTSLFCRTGAVPGRRLEAEVRADAPEAPASEDLVLTPLGFPLGEDLVLTPGPFCGPTRQRRRRVKIWF